MYLYAEESTIIATIYIYSSPLAVVLHTRAEQPWDIEVVGMELVMMEEELVMVMMTVMVMVIVTVMLPSLAVKEEVMLLQNEPVKVMVVEEEKTEAEQQ